MTPPAITDDRVRAARIVLSDSKGGENRLFYIAGNSDKNSLVTFERWSRTSKVPVTISVS